MSDLTSSPAIMHTAAPLNDEQRQILEAVARRFPTVRNLRFDAGGAAIHGDEPFVFDGKLESRLQVTALDTARFWAGLDPLPVDPLAQDRGGNPMAGKAREHLANARATGKP